MICTNCNRPLTICNDALSNECQAFGALRRLWIYMQGGGGVLGSIMTEAECILELAESISSK